MYFLRQRGLTDQEGSWPAGNRTLLDGSQSLLGLDWAHLLQDQGVGRCCCRHLRGRTPARDLAAGIDSFWWFLGRTRVLRKLKLERGPPSTPLQRRVLRLVLQQEYRGLSSFSLSSSNLIDSFHWLAVLRIAFSVPGIHWLPVWAIHWLPVCRRSIGCQFFEIHWLPVFRLSFGDSFPT